MIIGETKWSKKKFWDNRNGLPVPKDRGVKVLPCRPCPPKAVNFAVSLPVGLSSAKQSKCQDSHKIGQSSRLVREHFRVKCVPYHLPIQPPSTTCTSPVTKLLALLARYTAGPLKSSGEPHRPAGIRSNMLLALFGSLINAVY